MAVIGKGVRRSRVSGREDAPKHIWVFLRQWLFLVALIVGCGFAYASDSPTKTENLSGEIQQQLASAELVAQVEIVAVHRLLDRALSEPGMAAVSGYLYSAVARKVWKGATRKQLNFQLNLADCEKKLALGVRYLIFARRNIFGEMALSGCDAAIVDSDASGVLAQLDQYYQG
ncbi:hypothetical protein Mag101_09295 [Microbulbifer agarilyticus]|uniref:Uncharacterized protein n=1 Tax=Microbulbifer agarilyticus TaxID=260552 RepID=A0A1Q2M512_9GAMM|nr:hypothetical protein [Microbulbifer agarilyticus]AQQ67813.1 hypothetical protein Mag101_09295 [Microbulbifer agarilyticus]